MNVKLLYFHRVRESAGRGAEAAILPARATAADALDWAIRQHPSIAELRTIIRVAVNEEYVPEDKPLADGDIVALLPPLSGG